MRVSFRNLPVEAETKEIAREIVTEEFVFSDIVEYASDTEIDVDFITEEEE